MSWLEDGPSPGNAAGPMTLQCLRVPTGHPSGVSSGSWTPGIQTKLSSSPPFKSPLPCSPLPHAPHPSLPAVFNASFFACPTDFSSLPAPSTQPVLPQPPQRLRHSAKLTKPTSVPAKSSVPHVMHRDILGQHLIGYPHGSHHLLPLFLLYPHHQLPGSLGYSWGHGETFCSRTWRAHLCLLGLYRLFPQPGPLNTCSLAAPCLAIPALPSPSWEPSVTCLCFQHPVC